MKRGYMRLCKLAVENYARLPRLELDVREHLVLVGANDVGKTSILNMANLLLGASLQQIYQVIGVADIDDKTAPLVVRGVLCNFSDVERAAFPDDIDIAADRSESLTIQLEVRVSEDDPDSVVVRRLFPETSGRSVSREQLEVLGWHLLPAGRGAAGDYFDGRRSPLRTLLAAAELGSDGDDLRESLDDFNARLGSSSVLGGLRTRIAEQLSQSMPRTLIADNLSLRTTADPASDVLQDVSLFVKDEEGKHTAIKDQSDGVRQLMTMSFFDLAQDAANIVAIDEPELHLHASSQRTVADLFARGSAQRLLVTHSPYILQRFEPAQVAVVKADRTVRQIPATKYKAVEKEKANWWSPHLLEALTSRHVLLVEGVADKIIVEAAARARDVNLDRLGVTVLDIGGAGNFSHVNALLGENGFGLHLMGLVDLAESSPWIGGLKVKPKNVNVEKAFVCTADLEDEYVLAMGAPAVAAALITEGVAREQGILQSTGSANIASIQNGPMAEYLRKDKIVNAVAVGNHLTDAQVTAMPAINGLLTYITTQ